MVQVLFDVLFQVVVIARGRRLRACHRQIKQLSRTIDFFLFNHFSFLLALRVYLTAKSQRRQKSGNLLQLRDRFWSLAGAACFQDMRSYDAAGRQTNQQQQRDSSSVHYKRDNGIYCLRPHCVLLDISSTWICCTTQVTQLQGRNFTEKVFRRDEVAQSSRAPGGQSARPNVFFF